MQADFLEDFEVLTVETPENLELRLPLAGFGPRLLAQIVDNLILAVVTLVFIMAAVASATVTIPDAGGEDAMLVPMLIIILLLVFITAGYYVLFEQLWNGQTPGKRLCGIRVVRRGGLPLTFREVLIRNLVRMVDNLPTYGFVGIVSFFASRNQQRLGDLAADTVVIREFTSRVPFSWLAASGDGALGGSAGMLSPRMTYVVHNYLMRAPILPPAVRLELTERMIKALGYDSTGLNLQERDDYLASILRMHLAAQR